MLRDYLSTLPLRLVIAIPLAMLCGARALAEWRMVQRRRREARRGFDVVLDDRPAEK